MIESGSQRLHWRQDNASSLFLAQLDRLSAFLFHSMKYPIRCAPLALLFRQTQQASQWWHDRQSYYLRWQANQIRDGLLQRLFAVRRSLELCHQRNSLPDADHCQAWLTEIEQVHRSLRHLSDQLFPSHLEERLPLAIRYELERWHEQNPRIRLHLDLPSDWADELPERSRAILMILAELLRITLPSPPLASLPEPIAVCLTARNRKGILKIRIAYPDPATRIAYSRSPELVHLSRSFRLLTSGCCAVRYQGRIAVWSFGWRLF